MNINLANFSNELAGKLFENKKYQESIDQCNITLKLIGSRDPGILQNMAGIYFQLCDIEKSIELFKEYMELTKSTSKSDIRQLSYYLLRNNQHNESYDLIKNHLTECPEKHLDIGWVLHRDGFFKEAFIETELGRNGQYWTGSNRYPPNCSRWKGESINNKKICLIGEAGLGDEIIFSRWIKNLKEQGAQVYYFTNNTLNNVITRSFGIEHHNPATNYDYWVPAMSLPYLLQAEEPGNSVYLHPSLEHVEKWKQILNGYNNIIALNWTGDKNHPENSFRTIPIDYLADQIKPMGTLVSVCMGAESCPNSIIDLTRDIKSWDDTLAILSLSKICFTTSSSVSVASGAIGTNTFVYNNVIDYFTWCGTNNGEKTNWFKNVWVWRQDKLSDWQTPINQSVNYFKQNVSNLCV